MPMLSEDDLNLRDMSDEELERAWDLWFDLAQSTNDFDPPYTHGVFAWRTWQELGLPSPAARRDPGSAAADPAGRRG